MRLIDASLMFKCETCRNHRSGGCDTWCEHGESYRPDMSKLPTIDPEDLRPKGEWQFLYKDEEYTLYGCECGWRETSKTNYCPNCGAKMRGAEFVSQTPKEGE